MSSHNTTRACPLLTFVFTSSAKCAIASGSKADWWGPRVIAASISSSVQSRPVQVGQPNRAQSAKVSAASCRRASPCGAISRSSAAFFQSPQCSIGSRVFPLCTVHCELAGWYSSVVLRCALFCLRRGGVVAPVAIFPVASIIGGRNNVCIVSLPFVSRMLASTPPIAVLSSDELISMSDENVPCPSSNNALGSTRPPPDCPIFRYLMNKRIVLCRHMFPRKWHVSFEDLVWFSLGLIVEHINRAA
jgi:hypothetical protein